MATPGSKTDRAAVAVLAPIGLLIALAIPAPAAAAGSGGTDDGSLGRIDFPTSAGAEAQRHFLRGVLWMHSFEYSDAREAFRRAREVEPGFALAAWGEAMTHNHPIWVQVDVDAGRTALERLGASREERLASASTERERGYLAAVEELYFGAGDKAERDRAYADAMARLHRRWPDDHEAAAFYALALLGTCEGERDVATYMQGAAVAEEVFAANPEHPGALHYLIHAYDDAAHAPLGLRAARRYAGVAAAAPHARHMPSHIFLALGLWDATEDSNRDSWQASLDRGRPSYHALAWLQYALLQQGRMREAAALLDRAAADAAEGVDGAQGYLASMTAAQIVAGGSAAETPPADAGDHGHGAPAAARFASGYRAALDGDAAGAREAAAALREKAEGEEGRDAGAMRVAADELEALAMIAEARASDGDGAAGPGLGEKHAARRAVEVLRAAAEAESALPPDIGPPFPTKPAYELLGETLLVLGRAADAQAAFERALHLTPGRSLSLAGLAEAAAAAGDPDTAADARARLAANHRRADEAVAAAGAGSSGRD